MSSRLGLVIGVPLFAIIILIMMLIGASKDSLEAPTVTESSEAAKEQLESVVVGTTVEGRQIIAERGLTDINFVGFVPEEDLPGYYQAADIFCSPATGDESQGIVLLQSMAAGTPVLASSIAGYKTVITNNKDGILIDPLSESIFSSALLNLVKNKTLRRTLSSEGLKTIEKYDWNVVTEKILTVYKEAILKKKNPN